MSEFVWVPMVGPSGALVRVVAERVEDWVRVGFRLAPSSAGDAGLVSGPGSEPTSESVSVSKPVSGPRPRGRPRKNG